MLRILIPIVFIFLFSSNSSAQWWANGGNLLWPYGRVSIPNSGLSLGTNSSSATFNLQRKNSNNVFTYSDSNGIAYSKWYFSGSNPVFAWGDLDDLNNGFKFLLSVNSNEITQQALLIRIGDYEGWGNGTAMVVDDLTRKVSINASSLLFDGDKVEYSNLPSDSIGLATGQLYFDSNGFLKRKY